MAQQPYILIYLYLNHFSYINSIIHHIQIIPLKCTLVTKHTKSSFFQREISSSNGPNLHNIHEEVFFFSIHIFLSLQMVG